MLPSPLPLHLEGVSQKNHQTQLNVLGLVLIGCARLSRSHIQIKNLLNSYRAGAHSNLVTLDISALFSVAFNWSAGFGTFLQVSALASHWLEDCANFSYGIQHYGI
jgi:hypothetical protein